MLKWINQYGAQPVSDKAVPSPVNVEAVAQPALAHFANLDPARAGIPSQFPAQNFSEPSIDASLLGGSSDSGADATRTETAKSWEEIGGA